MALSLDTLSDEDFVKEFKALRIDLSKTVNDRAITLLRVAEERLSGVVSKPVPIKKAKGRKAQTYNEAYRRFLLG